MWIMMSTETGRYMLLTTQLAEGKIYSTGSGHAVATQRREKMFELETEVTPIPRPKLGAAKEDEMFDSDAVVQQVAENAFVESPRTKVTVRRAEKHASLPKKSAKSGSPASRTARSAAAAAATTAAVPVADTSDSKMVYKFQEIYFDNQPVVASVEHGLLEDGQYYQISMDAGLTNYDGLEQAVVPGLPGLDSYGDDLDLFELGLVSLGNTPPPDSFGASEFTPDDCFPLTIETTNNSNGTGSRSRMGANMSYYTASSSGLGLLRSASNGELFNEVETAMQDGTEITEYQIDNFGLSQYGPDNSTEIDASPRRILSNRSECEDEEDRHRHKRVNQQHSQGSEIREFGAPYENYQLFNRDVVGRIPNPAVRNTYLAARDPASIPATPHFGLPFAPSNPSVINKDGIAFSASSIGAPPAVTTQVYSQSFHFDLISTQAVQQAIDSGDTNQAMNSTAELVFDPDEVFEVAMVLSDSFQALSVGEHAH
jgi:hypothetical protein